MRIPGSTKLKVTCTKDPEDRRLGAWLGGSIIGSIDNLEQLWITAADYKERGRELVSTTCPWIKFKGIWEFLMNCIGYYNHVKLISGQYLWRICSILIFINLGFFSEIIIV